MSSDNINYDFSKISNNIYKKHKEYDILMKKTLTTKKIMPLNEFYEVYEKKAQEVCMELTPTREQPSISEFEELFQEFEEYPPNLQKPKKHSPKKINRSFRGSNTSLSASTDTLPSNAAFLVEKFEQPVPDVRKVYAQFKELQQKLLKIMALNDKCGENGENLQNVQLQQLDAFSRDLDKLLPSDSNVLPAFDDDELVSLELLKQQVEQLNFIKQNQNMFDVAAQTQSTDNIDERRRQINEIINNCLTALSF